MELYCQTTLNYSGGLDQVAVDVNLHDGRAALDTLDYEDCGFTLLSHRSSVEDWRDEAHLSRVHRPEIERLAREFTGCDAAIVYPPLIRSPEAEKKIEDYGTIEFAHSDFTEDYRGMVSEEGRAYRDFLDPLLAEAGLGRRHVAEAERILLLQFWRNTGPTRPDRPLALCDARTVPRSQLQSYRIPYYGGFRLDFETFGLLAPASPDDNEWYTFPNLSADEVIAFRTYDSRCVDEGRPFWTPHSAFLDPSAGEDPPRRESVEMRALCLFGV